MGSGRCPLRGCPQPRGAHPGQPQVGSSARPCTHHGGSAPVLRVVCAGGDEFVTLEREGGGGSNTDTWRCESAEFPLSHRQIWDRGVCIIADVPCSGASPGTVCFPHQPRGSQDQLLNLRPLGKFPRAVPRGWCFLLSSLSKNFCRAEAPKKKMHLGNNLNCQTYSQLGGTTASPSAVGAGARGDTAEHSPGNGFNGSCGF